MARELYAARAWRDAHQALSEVDRLTPLELDDLWRCAWAASLSGDERSSLSTLERIYEAHVENRAKTACRAAFWLGFRLVLVGESSRGQGWLARAERCLERVSEPCVEQGYLLIPRVRAHFTTAAYDEALELAGRAAGLGERFRDRELATFARNLQGRILVRQGSLEAGFRLLDESMLAVTRGELSPLLTGLVYCAAIDSCQGVFALGRVREWTESLRGWCDAQPQLVTFTGACRVCRAEMMEVGGQWSEALAEAELAAEVFLATLGARAAGEALYRQGEIHRLRGELELAETRYRDASESGRDPQPGLSLLRLAQGKADVALSALRRALAGAGQPLAQVKLLPALVETLLACGKIEAARSAVGQLDNIAAGFRTEMLTAASALARAAVELAEGDAHTALSSLTTAFGVFQEFDAPYLAARCRALRACACQALDDRDGAELELAAARAAFLRLGALPDVKALDALRARASGSPSVAGLTARELEVLRLVASGKTNKQIAGGLCLSEKTVDRHLSNILAKLDVPTRAAATAFAYENKLI
jgi:DNA-binding CsgD family transcriptional regulator